MLRHGLCAVLLVAAPEQPLRTVGAMQAEISLRREPADPTSHGERPVVSGSGFVVDDWNSEISPVESASNLYIDALTGERSKEAGLDQASAASSWTQRDPVEASDSAGASEVRPSKAASRSQRAVGQGDPAEASDSSGAHEVPPSDAASRTPRAADWVAELRAAFDQDLEEAELSSVDVQGADAHGQREHADASDSTELGAKRDALLPFAERSHQAGDDAEQTMFSYADAPALESGIVAQTPERWARQVGREVTAVEQELLRVEMQQESILREVGKLRAGLTASATPAPATPAAKADVHLTAMASLLQSVRTSIVDGLDLASTYNTLGLHVLPWAIVTLFAGIIYSNWRPVVPDIVDNQPTEMDTGTWRYDFCGCCEEPELTALTFCCAGVVWADTMRMARYYSFPVALVTFVICVLLSALGLGIAGIVFVFILVWHRQMIRQKFSMQLGCMTWVLDCFAVGFCPILAFVQENRQLSDAHKTGWMQEHENAG
mmetsp:Transcript_11598/g.31048  ORF Transcript_11598/g.31048 Transcript_11598/m.31048 type:complete len:492 (-) Transcript_11598:65-1540(-)